MKNKSEIRVTWRPSEQVHRSTVKKSKRIGMTISSYLTMLVLQDQEKELGNVKTRTEGE